MHLLNYINTPPTNTTPNIATARSPVGAVMSDAGDVFSPAEREVAGILLDLPVLIHRAKLSPLATSDLIHWGSTRRRSPGPASPSPAALSPDTPLSFPSLAFGFPPPAKPKFPPALDLNVSMAHSPEKSSPGFAVRLPDLNALPAGWHLQCDDQLLQDRGCPRGFDLNKSP